MVDRNDPTPQGEEIILCVRYTSFLGWLGGIILIVASCAAIYSPYVLIPRGEYGTAITGSIGGLITLVFGSEIFLTRHILFYRDRVVKVWYFLGQRTIPYENAMLMTALPFKRWMGNAYLLKEVDSIGNPISRQIPIYYIARYVPRETAKQVDAIVSYLVGEENGPKIHTKRLMFEKTTLPKRVLCPGIPGGHLIRIKGGIKSRA